MDRARKRSPGAPRRRTRFHARYKARFSGHHLMDISRSDQRILHLMAQGGWIEIHRDERRKIEKALCFSRDGWLYPGFDVELFRRLKRLKAISSRQGKPYRITERGLRLVRAELDNR
jgi:uncharacterized protein YjhX (UPF0386 family)